MPSRGLHISARSLPLSAKLVILSGIVFLIYTFRKNLTSLIDTFTNLSTMPATVYNYLLSAGITSVIAKYATAQSAFETAKWSSNIYKSNNNAFGMKYAGQSASLGTKNGYADYASLQMSVADFAVWYIRHRLQIFSLPLVINSLQDYIDFLSNNDYFEADKLTYFNGCQYYYSNMFPNG